MASLISFHQKKAFFLLLCHFFPMWKVGKRYCLFVSKNFAFFSLFTVSLSLILLIRVPKIALLKTCPSILAFYWSFYSWFFKSRSKIRITNNEGNQHCIALHLPLLFRGLGFCVLVSLATRVELLPIFYHFTGKKLLPIYR